MKPIIKAMIKNYLKTTLRSLFKNRSYSFLNITGLAIGIACASLIFLWMQDELTFNHNFSKRDQLYTIYENQVYNGKTSTFKATPGPLWKAVKTEIPGIKDAARTSGEGRQLFALGDKSIYENGSYADRELIDMLDIRFTSGNRTTALQQVNEVVINESMAKKFFGDADPVGKTLRFDNQQDLTVTGVFKDLPKNSTLQFHWLMPMVQVENKQPWQQSWGANWARTYVELEPLASVAQINAKLEYYLREKTGNKEGKTTCFLYAMNDWNLHNNFVDGKMEGGRITYVRLFSLIAWIILLIACINFMNLSTARSGERAKEVGVRKVMGAAKGKLIAQFIIEAIMLSFASVLIAIALVYVTLPYFNTLVEKQLVVEAFQPAHLGYLLAIGFVTGLLAGSYPAFYLSSFNPITVLKSIRIKSGGFAGFIRQGLVVMQFTVSIVLVIATVIIYQQIQHVKTRNLGFNKNNLVYIDAKGQTVDHFNSIYNDLKQSGVVANASLSTYPALSIWNNTDNYSWQGKDVTKNPLITFENVSYQFVSTMGMKIIAGRDFYSDPRLDSTNVIINEALAKQMGSEGRIGGIVMDNRKRPFTIVGIIKDFLYNDMYAPGAPLLLYNQPKGTFFLNVRLKDGVDLQAALSKAVSIIKADNPGYPVDYTFVDDDFNQIFKTETLTGQLAAVFAVLAIFISCLGLFGLAAYTAERRTKEIGIRKVLGASASGLAGLLSKDFMKLVGIACIIAFPVAFWATQQWLQSYQYRIGIEWWVFAIAGTAAILIALTTVSFQAIRTALMNPVKSLRSE